MSSLPDVSIVVPTRGRPSSLVRCLAALEGQDLAEPYEIVVVDDASPDAAPVAEAVGRSQRARLVRLDRRRGPGAARNAGGRAACGSLLLFTDDDCEPAPGWADALVGRLRGGAMVAAGATSNGRSSSRCATAAHLLTEYFTASTSVPFAASNNLGCAAEVLAAVPFDESFPDAAGEDRDWCARVAERGLELETIATARIKHNHDLTFRRFWRQQLRYGRGAYRYHRRTDVERPLEEPGFYLALIRRGLGEGVAVAGLVALSQAAIVTGFALEAGSALRRGQTALRGG